MASVGDYLLHHTVGRGGMGTVWYATQNGSPTAIKFVRRDPSLVVREIHAMASLDHPGIAKIYDYGTTTAEDDCDEAPGTPWIAMEFTQFGTLESVARSHRADWIEIADQILAALAHAHARGITHRDLKPANVLVSSLEPIRIKLADFGLARHITTDERGNPERTSGTPKYMSPEQIMGRVRDQGPWTDLYGFGCVMYWFVTGTPPFVNKDIRKVFRAHVHDPLPPIAPLVDVPSSIEVWLSRLTGKSFLNRYRFAADARRDLEHASTQTISMIPSSEASEYSDATETDVSPATVSDLTSRNLPFYSLRTDEPAFYFEPGKIQDWRDGQAAREPSPRTPSISLFGLREIPLIGREKERDAMWHTLGESQSEGVRWIDVRGERGTGKSKLATWFVERCHETGTAHTFVARNSQSNTSEAVLANMLARFFGCQVLRAKDELDTLSLDTIVARIAYVFRAYGIVEPELGAIEVASFVHNVLSPSGAREERRESRSWHTPMVAFFERLSLERPIVVYLDDVYWGYESIAFLERLLEEELPIVIVTTARTDQGSASLSSLTELAGQRRREIAVDTLSKSESHELISELLSLDDQLVEQVFEQTDGNPLFIVQLVEGWIRSGALQQSADVQTLTDPELPRDLDAVWREQLIRAKSNLSESQFQALQIAAAIGTDVPRWLLSEVCLKFGVIISDVLLSDLVELGFLKPTEQGWRFTHGSAARICREMQAESGVSSSHHRKIADTYSARFGNVREHSEVIADQWLAAAQPVRALPFLLDAAEHAARLSDFPRVKSIYERYERAVLNGTDQDVARGLVNRARNLMFTENLDEIEKLLVDAEQLVGSDPELRGDLFYARARLKRHRGKSPESIPLAQQALEHFEKANAEKKCAETHRTLGEAFRRTGAYEESETYYTLALQYYETVNDPFLAGWSHFGLAALMKQIADWTRARDHLDLALKGFEAAYSRSSLAVVYNEMGEVERLRDDYKKALSFYARALPHFATGDGNEAVAQFNIALCHIALGDIDLAIPHLKQAQAFIERTNRGDVKSYVALAMMLCCAKKNRWDDFQTYYGDARSDSFPPDPDVARLLEQNAVECLNTRRDTQGRELAEFAIEAWTKVGRTGDADRVKAMIA